MDPKLARTERLTLGNFLSAWADNLSQVLSQVTQSEFRGKAGAARQPEEDRIRVCFSLHGSLEGEQGFALGAKNAVWLAQTLMAEPPDGSIELTEIYRDALGEIFRQFAGAASAALKPLAGGEVEIRFERIGDWQWEAAYEATIGLMSDQRPELLLRCALDNRLVKVLEKQLPDEESPKIEREAGVQSPKSSSSGANLDLLLDVELEVSLRFGQRDMLLAEVLELSAGAVVELNQKIQEPVELLVSGKVVARGEVVVMDGHYALRVLEIVSPAERMASLQA